MNMAKALRSHVVPVTLAIGLTVAGNFTSAWGAEVPSSQAAPVIAAEPAKAAPQVPLVDDRLLAIGLGVLGGIATYTIITGGWGMGAARMARTGMPVAAMRWGAGWGGRWIFATASGVVGALVGDWIHRSNEAAATTH